MKFIRNLILPVVVSMAAIGLTVASAVAALLPPIGLSPGDQYRIAFVTSTTTDATSSNIADYNDFVTNVANSSDLADLGTTWTAIASTLAVAAQNNTNTNPIIWDGVGIYNTNGDKIADNNADLWDGDIDSPILFDEDGISTPNPVWTGTIVSGTPHLIHYLGSAGSLVETGHSLQQDQTWIDAFIIDLDTNHHNLYALSGTLIVPSVVPLPASLPLYGAGLAVFGFIGWRRSRSAAGIDHQCPSFKRQ